jgi:hypothetical protein
MTKATDTKAPAPIKTTLIEALIAAAISVGSVAKGSRNEYAKFDYASAEDMLAAARAALLPQGLHLCQVSWKPLDSTMYEIVYRLSHIGGETLYWSNTVPVVEQKGKPIDKALSSMLTTDFGYAVRGLLCLPRVESQDVEGRDDTHHVPAQPPPRNQGPTSAEIRDRALRALENPHQDLAELQAKLSQYFEILTDGDKQTITMALTAAKAKHAAPAQQTLGGA